MKDVFLCLIGIILYKWFIYIIHLDFFDNDELL